MKPLFLFLLAASVFFLDAQAQDTDETRKPVTVTVTTNAPSSEDSRPASDELPLRGSRRALTFGLNGFQLGEIEGGVGGKYWVSSSTALRGSFTFAVGASEGDEGTARTDGRSSIEFGIALLVERHSLLATPTGRVSPYLAGGFTFGVGGFSQNARFPLASEIQRIDNDGSTLDFGVLAGLGVAYRISRRVALSGEHTFGASIRSTSHTETIFRTGQPNEVSESDQRDFVLGTGTSRLMVSVYF